MRKKLIEVTEEDVRRICPKVPTCEGCPIHKVCAYSLVGISDLVNEETEIPDEFLLEES